MSLDLFRSKKFQASTVGIIVVIISAFIPELDEAEVTKIVALIISYVVGQGLADFGKEQVKRGSQEERH